jgi:hypothetical protein
MPRAVENPREPAAEPLSCRRSFFGRIFHGAGWLVAAPFVWTGAHRIKRGWSLIGDLWGALRAGPPRDNRFMTADRGGAFDIAATAVSYGVPVDQLEAWLAARRRQTARIAYAAFALAWLFLLGWIWHALASPWMATRFTSALYFLPFCALFFLVAFYNALLNYQIRSGRLANWRDYLATPGGFWPN